MRYNVRHTTRFAYGTPISESVMEVRMQPRSDGAQRCLNFSLTTTPGARILMYQDHDGNVVHHFNIPAKHDRLTLTADALVECEAPPPLPHRLGPGAWQQIESMASTGEYWEYLSPSTFARPTESLLEFARALRLERGNDPFVTLRRLMAEIYKRFEYNQASTQVDSPIDEALEKKAGVCQDFAHIFIALVRSLGVPARYVSGYLFHQIGQRGAPVEGASHAWVEVLLPQLGWVGLDPTNNLLAEDRHIRVAIGRDYADVPPTRGVYKGLSVVRSELAVSVSVGPVKDTSMSDIVPFTPWRSRDADAPQQGDAAEQKQQQQ